MCGVCSLCRFASISVHGQRKIPYHYPYFSAVGFQYLFQDGRHCRARRTLEIGKLHDRYRRLYIASTRIVVDAYRLYRKGRFSNEQANVGARSQSIGKGAFQTLSILILQILGDLIANCRELARNLRLVIRIEFCDLCFGGPVYLFAYLLAHDFLRSNVAAVCLSKQKQIINGEVQSLLRKLVSVQPQLVSDRFEPFINHSRGYGTSSYCHYYYGRREVRSVCTSHVNYRIRCAQTLDEFVRHLRFALTLQKPHDILARRRRITLIDLIPVVLYELIDFRRRRLCNFSGNFQVVQLLRTDFSFGSFALQQ